MVLLRERVSEIEIEREGGGREEEGREGGEGRCRSLRHHYYYCVFPRQCQLYAI